MIPGYSRILEKAMFSHRYMSKVLSNIRPDHFDSLFLRTLNERGFLYQCTDYNELDRKCSKESIVAYLGFDATAPSLHVGSLVQIMMLKHLQNCGHKPIILLGGGTTKVGDPSGKDASRQLLSEDAINQNISALGGVFSKFLRVGDGLTDAIIVNNADWLNDLKYLDFLRDSGRHITVNRMLSFESVKQRLTREQPLSFLEFNYMLLQAYDFCQLAETRGACLQLGGSDQWGNIVCGVDLARKLKQVQLHGVTAPLVMTSDGRKMGKTAEGAVWLNSDLMTAYDYWQFWRNTPDADVIRFLKLFTEVPLDDINQMSFLQGSELNDVKIRLADEATTLLHGHESLQNIHQTTAALYSSVSSSGEQLSSLPTLEVKNASEIGVIDALVQSNLASSRSDARRQIAAGAVRLDGVQISDCHMIITGSSRFKLSSGKKKHILLVFE